ncbi:LuxR C-terminal-related transcriptional regulator [Streptomyces microflavus]|uniref:LuxR C-terminal-related transcriptional regulator n=1 Tax=Streptomyces microflavus TaxID=1919 RepID=UPI0029AC8E35|nr:LuxR C-terminal-related transcriptional regulator [Streptomyces microflavus]MDX2402178.1 LuxR C-terminal-related transcriptional regulator [Streptomyces microflavus]
MTSSTTVHSPPRLYGRSGELAILHGMLARLRQGDGGALVLTAPPGLGRTALLREAAAAHRLRGPVLYATAAPAERALPHSGLHALLCPAPGPPPMPRPPSGLTPDALLARLRELGRERPLLVCADDAHAWDPASRTALNSAARRLGAGSRVAVLIAAHDGPTFAGLPALRLGPLDDDAAAALLDRLTGVSGGAEGVGRRAAEGLAGGAGFPSGAEGFAGGVGPSGGTEGPGRRPHRLSGGTEGLDPVVRAELLREAAGNPRLLAGLTGRLTPDQLAGRTPLPCPLPGAEGVLAAYADRLDGLPAHTRALLLLAAAAQEHEPAGAGADALLLLRAGTRTGLPRDFLDGVLFGSTATEGLLQRAGSRVHFSHPLFARAVLHHAPPARRRATHELLAALLAETGGRATDPAASALSGGHPAPQGAPVRSGEGPGPVPHAGARATSSARPVRSGDGPEPAAHAGARVTSSARPVRSGDGPEPAAHSGSRVTSSARSVRSGDGPEPAAHAGGHPASPGPAAHPGAGPGEAPQPGAHAASSARPAHPGARPAPLPTPAAAFAEHPAPLASLVQLACGAPGPDTVLAARLEAAATSSYPHAERSSALSRAAALTAEQPLRSARFAAAAEQAALAGDPARARGLLARTGAAGEHTTAPGLAPYVHGLLALRSGPAADAHEALLAAAALLGPHDPRRALDALLGAAEAAWVMGDAPGYLTAMGRVDPTPYDRDFASYRAGMRAVLAGRTEAGHALLRQCLDPADPDPPDPVGRNAPAALLRAGVAALVLGEVAVACRTGARALAAVRTRGPDALLPQALEHLAYAELRAGLHAGARAHALEGLHAARRTGQPNSSVHLHAVLALAASVEGPAEACAAHCDAALAGAGPHGLAQPATLATWARARADLAAGRSEEAAARLGPLVRPGPRQGHFAARMLAVPCYVEAAVLAGRGAEEAGELRAAVAEFAGWTARTADPQAPAQLARCHALLATAEEADARYAEALAHHDRAGGDFERARTQLLYGQWLRRRRRTREARTPLRDALVAFQRCSARAWAERAGGELRAAGEPVGVVRDTGGGALSALTPQQQRIARCVAEGATNREVALRLSLSPRTVDHHLRNVFAALGIRSRTELARLLGPEGP